MALTDRADGGYGSHIAQIIDDQGALDDLAEAARRPVPTGLAGLDGLVDGWMPGQLILLAARPAVGKSAMALQLARAAAEARIGTLLFTLEMTSRETLQRMAAATANVPLTAVKRGSMDAGQSEAVSRAETALRELPLWVDDSTSATIMSLRAKCRHHQQRNHVGLVVVDYLQLMGSASGGRDANRQQEVADISRGLKLMAKELAIPVIALSQLNRVSESRADKRPQLSDLRDSGALEQDADVVMLLHDKTKPDMPSGGDIMWTGPGQGFAAKPFREVDLIVAKQRSGPSGSVPLVFDGSKMRFGPRIDADAYPA
jgi:replicative DNA helicase